MRDPHNPVERDSRVSGFVVWFTGLSAAGKTTVANIVEAELEQRGLLVDHLDGDIVRTHLSKGLGFSKEDRDANIARIGWVASRLARAGAAVVVSAISPYEEARRHARSLVESHAPFIEVYVGTPPEACARRDPKGPYAAAFAGELDDFTGVSVQESIDRGRVVEETGPRASRNRLQTTTLLDAIEEHGFDAAIGGARRDEERARAKERIFSFRDDFGQWNPRAQRPELWNLYNARVRKGEHVRAFPISNWTELDVWQYVAREQLELPPIYFSHERAVFRRDGMLYACSDYVERPPGEDPFAAR